jgi:hypothetical protein
VGAVKAHYATDQFDISDVSCLVGFAIMTRNDEICALYRQVPLANRHESCFQPADISSLDLATSQSHSLLLLICMPCFVYSCMISRNHSAERNTGSTCRDCGMLRAGL